MLVHDDTVTFTGYSLEPIPMEDPDLSAAIRYQSAPLKVASDFCH